MPLQLQRRSQDQHLHRWRTSSINRQQGVRLSRHLALQHRVFSVLTDIQMQGAPLGTHFRVIVQTCDERGETSRRKARQ
jgi:hypothetical protein